MAERQEQVTRLLNEAAGGESQAARELLPMLYAELRALAASYFVNERDNHTLQPTALVHEAYLKLVDQNSVEWKSRNQFFVVAAKAMRNILIDHARGKNRQKRGGDWKRVTLDGGAADVSGGSSELDSAELLAIHEAMEKLASLDERKAQLIELRFFTGMKIEDAAAVLGISRTTASEEWRMARAWLHRELRGER